MLKRRSFRGFPCVQGIGDVITKTDRCIAFPNLYQHQVQPFKLADPKKPGHRKILVFFLVDPTYRVPSATDVAPQQKEWLTDLTHRRSPGTRFARLPIELVDLIVNEYGDAMTREEAEAYRKELMAERSVAVQQSNSSYFEVVSPPTFSSPSLWDRLSSPGCITGIQYVVRVLYSVCVYPFLRYYRPPFPANIERLRLVL